LAARPEPAPWTEEELRGLLSSLAANLNENLGKEEEQGPLSQNPFESGQT